MGFRVVPVGGGDGIVEGADFHMCLLMRVDDSLCTDIISPGVGRTDERWERRG